MVRLGWQQLPQTNGFINLKAIENKCAHPDIFETCTKLLISEKSFRFLSRVCVIVCLTVHCVCVCRRTVCVKEWNLLVCVASSLKYKRGCVCCESTNYSVSENIFCIFVYIFYTVYLAKQKWSDWDFFKLYLINFHLQKKSAWCSFLDVVISTAKKQIIFFFLASERIQSRKDRQI